MAGLKDDLTQKNTQPPGFKALDSKNKTQPPGLLVSILKKKINRQILKPSIPKKNSPARFIGHDATKKIERRGVEGEWPPKNLALE